MSKGVIQALTNCLIKHGRINAEEAEDYIQEMQIIQWSFKLSYLFDSKGINFINFWENSRLYEDVFTNSNDK